MSLHPLASMLVKVLGLYTALQSLNVLSLVWRQALDVIGDGLPFINGYFDFRFTWADMVPTLIMGVAQISVGMGLWRYSDTIARSMVGDEDSTVPTAGVDWAKVGLGMVGTYLMADSACRVVLFVWVLMVAKSAVSSSSDFLPFIGAALVRGAIGLWLLLGVRGIVRGVMNLKNIGRDAAMEEMR